MASFDTAIAYVLSNEGEFIDSPNDRGGATNFGLSLRFLRTIPAERLRKYGIFKAPELLSPEDVKDITRPQAEIIYKGEFWDTAPFEKINNAYICNYVFDMTVNHGLTHGIKLLQRAMCAAKGKVNFVLDDGILGDVTIAAIDSLSPLSLEIAMRAERAEYVYGISERDSREEEFLHGWLNRCYRI